MVRSAYHVARKWLLEGKHKADKGSASNSKKMRELWRLRDIQSEVDWEIFATTAWCLWKNRNLIKYEGRGKPTKAIVGEAENLVEEFHNLNTTTS